METCIICEKINKGYKTRNGIICQSCAKILPKAVIKQLKNIDTSDVEKAYGYYLTNDKLFSHFRPTLEYKNLQIDETLGLILLGRESDRNIFDVMELADESFSIHTKNRVKDEINCRVYASFRFDTPNIRIDDIDMGKFKVPVEEDDADIFVSLPYKIQILEHSIIELNHKKINEYNYKLENAKSADNDELLKAKGFYLIDGEYTKAQLKEYRAKMLKMFHPDNNPLVQIDGIIDKINEYYYILLGGLNE